jgi:hypothetical protein
VKEIFLKGQQAGLSLDDIDEWIRKPFFDPRSWVLVQGAPRAVVEIFPEYVGFMARPGSDMDEPGSVVIDVADPSIQFVRLWELAGRARSLVDVGNARNVDRDYVEHIGSLAEELELLRDQIRDALLTDQDRADGAAPRAPS